MALSKMDRQKKIPGLQQQESFQVIKKLRQARIRIKQKRRNHEISNGQSTRAHLEKLRRVTRWRSLSRTLSMLPKPTRFNKVKRM